jgi:rhodanese-related sulfurtransferase
MKKILLLLLIILPFLTITSTHAAEWQTETPDGYLPITWARARGVTSFVKAPDGGGYTDYLTFIYLPYNQIKLITSSSTPRASWGAGVSPFDAMLNVQNWAVPKFAVEKTKSAYPDMQFMWNAPFFNSTITPTDLSLALKSADAGGTYISSGSRPANDTTEARKMLLINNQAGTAQIADFDPQQFAASTTDQGVESFAASVASKGTSSDIERIFIGVKPGGKELVIYCSRGASPDYASRALLAAGVPTENQIQMDGGTSATCAYNLPGQYFVEPGRTLPYLMGAFPALPQGTITLETLNVRSGPGTANKVVDKIKKGTIVKMYEEKNGWTRIDHDEQRWISSQYVKKIAR